MYFVLLSLLAQISCLVSLCHSGHEYFYLFWYIPNWVASALILLPRIEKGEKKNADTVLKVLFICALVGNVVITVLFQHLRWVGVVPAVVTACLALAYELCQEDSGSINIVIESRKDL